MKRIPWCLMIGLAGLGLLRPEAASEMTRIRAESGGVWAEKELTLSGRFRGAELLMEALPSWFCLPSERMAARNGRWWPPGSSITNLLLCWSDCIGPAGSFCGRCPHRPWCEDPVGTGQL